MRLDRAFLLSLYLTLFLACVCLSYTLAPLLPEAGAIAWTAGALFVVAFALEGRWTLSVLAANGLMLLVAAAAGIWIAYRLFEPPPGFAEQTYLPSTVLPQLGVLLIVLMVAKLFRPKKVADFWSLYGIAFVSLALACVLDSDFVLGPMLLLFWTCAVWSLTLFYLYRGRLQASLRLALPWRAGGFFRACRRTLAMLAIALVLFFLTPRIVSPQADLLKMQQIQSGMSDSGIDLNRTGMIRLNTAVAFEVQAADAAGRPKGDLNPGQRWRCQLLNAYERGCWSYRSTAPRAPVPVERRRPAPGEQDDLPDLGPGQYYLTYVFALRRAHRLPLAEPVVLPADPRQVPAVSLYQGPDGVQQVAWSRYYNGELVPPLLPRQERYRYLQVTLPDFEPPPVDLSAYATEFHLRTPAVAELREWTEALLDRLAAEGKLTRADVEKLPDGRLARSHEKVARAIEAYFVLSGEYTYTLDLPRKNMALDPVLDFLWNVKSGHCERYASALALLLRAQGIPTRLVVGFRGAEAAPDGWYAVRHSAAHSWVEAAVPGPDGRSTWLTLDPTPSWESEESGGLAGWWRGLVRGAGSFWQRFVVDYHADRQEATTQEFWVTVAGGFLRLGRLLLDPVFWAVAGPLALLLWWLRQRRQARVPQRRWPAEVAFYARLLDVLERRCELRPLPAQTPREFAGSAARQLRELSLPEEVAGVPARAAELLYRVRFAGRPLSPAEMEEIGSCIQELDRRLGERRAEVAKVGTKG